MDNDYIDSMDTFVIDNGGGDNSDS